MLHFRVKLSYFLQGFKWGFIVLILKFILRKLIRLGTLTLIDSHGKRHVFGGEEGLSVTIRFTDNLISWKLVFSPSLALGEGYMDGRIMVENGTIFDLLSLFGKNLENKNKSGMYEFLEPYRKLFRRFQQYNPIITSHKNVAHHYDLSNELYSMFLDKDLQYSCAYFNTPSSDLESAQEQKKVHIAAKLSLKGNQNVLDIGSGWGGMGLFLAKNYEVNVTGVTLSLPQLRVSQQRAIEEHLSDRVTFKLQDYRKLTGTFDRIVSVGMFEHVGINQYQIFFETVEKLLSDDGVILLHTIGRNTPPSVTDPWIRKYIFPGGYIPALSEISKNIEKTSFFITDIEFLGPHYANTLRHWRLRFKKNREIIKSLYDERFCKMWEFYLAASETAFRYLGMTVYQIQLTKQNGIIPITRDYIEGSKNKIVANKK